MLEQGLCVGFRAQRTCAPKNSGTAHAIGCAGFVNLEALKDLLAFDALQELCRSRNFVGRPKSEPLLHAGSYEQGLCVAFRANRSMYVYVCLCMYMYNVSMSAICYVWPPRPLIAQGTMPKKATGVHEVDVSACGCLPPAEHIYARSVVRLCA